MSNIIEIATILYTFCHVSLSVVMHFMWMLMEGVVLYVKIVKLFTADHKRYIAFFTIASYGNRYSWFVLCLLW